MSSISQEAHAESGRAADQNKTPETASASYGFNGNMENVFSSGTAETENIGRRPEPNNTDTGNIVADLRALLGQDVVLIPVRQGQKAPAFSGWQETTIEAMNTPAHVAGLYAGNIGVVLGANSRGLCAIDIDADDQVEPFLTLNPLLRTTLRTRGREGCADMGEDCGGIPTLREVKGPTGGSVG